ncbi:transcriptional regulator, LysR family [Noviherbaspirillum humi]|uniref:Transcriptional regulator, LysR family n=1 Tax=Noviherbaspirillum humi TaxID=1688639 RepID=A0A239IGM1_9BURK|nr:LysR family transcriptional regulator [Noviherbaspirillum humi]SNS92572.1 transcriptional regulator, LysR family [Noviherbaspirillum humi]
MDFRDLKYFEEIASQGHVGRAAEKLCRTQPALTKCIDRLEEEIGERLFERSGRGIQLTGAGKVLLARTRQMGLLMDETMREIQDFAQGLEGHIRLGCVPTLAEHLLPDISEKLLGEARNVTLQLVVAMNDALLARLKDGELDLVVGPLVQNSDFEGVPIIEDDVVVLASANHEIFRRPVTMQALLDHKWVLPATTVASRQWLDQTFDRCGLPRPTVQITSTVLNLLLPLVERTGLLGFASRLNLSTGRANLREVCLPETTMRRRMGIAYRKNAYLSPAVRRLIALLQDNREMMCLTT